MHGAATERLKRVRVGLARLATEGARTGSVSMNSEGWQDLLAIIARKRNRGRRRDLRDFNRGWLGALAACGQRELQLSSPTNCACCRLKAACCSCCWCSPRPSSASYMGLLSQNGALRSAVHRAGARGALPQSRTIVSRRLVQLSRPYLTVSRPILASPAIRPQWTIPPPVPRRSLPPRQHTALFARHCSHRRNMCRHFGADSPHSAMDVSQAREVLPTNVKPLHYDLTLEPNFGDFTYTGSVTIECAISISYPLLSYVLTMLQSRRGRGHHNHHPQHPGLEDPLS